MIPVVGNIAEEIRVIGFRVSVIATGFSEGWGQVIVDINVET